VHNLKKRLKTASFLLFKNVLTLGALWSNITLKCG